MIGSTQSLSFQVQANDDQDAPIEVQFVIRDALVGMQEKAEWSLFCGHESKQTTNDDSLVIPNRFNRVRVLRA